MKKIFALFLSFLLLFCTSFNAFASTNDTLKITETTTVGEVMRFSNPNQYYSYSPQIRKRLDATNINKDSDVFIFSSKNENNILAAALSSKASSPEKGKIKLSGTVKANVICPDISLTAVVYDSNGNVVKTYVNGKGSTKSVTLTRVTSQLNSKEKYKVIFTGVVDPPAGYEPAPGIVTYTRTVTVK